ncbi:TPA: hypothetical protein ACT9MW_001129, partial [Legionella pneumophila]
FNAKMEMLPDILKAVRIGYEKAEIWSQMDSYLYEEKKAHRKFILSPQFWQFKSLFNLNLLFTSHVRNIVSGYSTKSFRIILSSVIIAFIFALLYFYLGGPVEEKSNAIAALDALSLSLNTFVGFSYSDQSYSSIHPFMRLLCVIESWIGLICMSLFVVVLARKIIR